MSKFTSFPLLPPELRLRIWQTIGSTPQTIELSCTPTSSAVPSGRWFSHSKPPILFLINAESRYIAIREYKRLQFYSNQVGVPWGGIYINFERDTLWLCGDLSAVMAKDLLEKNEMLKAKLKFLCVGESLWKGLNQRAQRVGMEEQVAVAYGIEARPDIKLTTVSRGLRALEDVKYHS